MMLYLCNHSNVNLFDWLNDSSLVEQPFMLKKISSNQLDLTSFAKKEALSINYYKYLSIDLSAVTNDSESFKLALQSIQMLNPKLKIMYIDIGNKVQALREAIGTLGDIPVISANPKQDMNLFKTQVADSINYIPASKDIEKEENKEISEQPQEVLNKNGADIISSKAARKQYVFPGKDVMAVVVNVYPRAGATTLSINMAAYLHSIGAAVAYVECNSDKNHLDMLSKNYPGFVAAKENRLDRNGVIYMKSEIPEGMDFVINDMSGLIQDGSEQNILEFIAKGNIVVLCGTSKPYELEEIRKKIKILEENNCNRIYLCLASTPESEKAQLLDMFGSKSVSVYFTGYTPDMFKSTVNGDMYGRIFQEYILEQADDKMLKIF